MSSMPWQFNSLPVWRRWCVMEALSQKASVFLFIHRSHVCVPVLLSLSKTLSCSHWTVFIISIACFSCNTLPSRRTLKNSRLLCKKDDVHVCIMCLRAIMNYQVSPLPSPEDLHTVCMSLWTEAHLSNWSQIQFISLPALPVSFIMQRNAALTDSMAPLLC